MADKVEVRSVEIPGMHIQFRGPIGPNGVGIDYQVSVDQTISREDLDELLDRINGARMRQEAAEYLAIDRQSLEANLKLLEAAKRDRATHVAQMNGRVAQMQQRRRGEVHANQQDINALANFDTQIIKIEGQIEGARARIPYYEALIDGHDIDLKALPALRAMAAE